LLQGIR